MLALNVATDRTRPIKLYPLSYSDYVLKCVKNMGIYSEMYNLGCNDISYGITLYLPQGF